MDQIKSTPGVMILKRMRIPHIRPIWVAGFAVWSVLLGIGIFAILWEPAPPERGSLSLGSVDAPVTVVEFADFTWRFCREFALGPGREIIDQYVESGRVRFEFRHLLVHGPDATLAAQAGECAAQQGRFWEFHDAIYGEWGPDVFGRENNKQVAQAIGLDSSAFDKCLDRGRVLTHVQSDVALGLEMGVRSTPTVFVNGRRLEGLHDFSDYQQFIEEELTAAGF